MRGHGRGLAGSAPVGLPRSAIARAAGLRRAGEHRAQHASGAILPPLAVRGQVLGGDRGHWPAAGPDAAAAALARREAAERAAHRLVLEVERLKAEGVLGHAAIARVLTERGVPTPRGGATWTHTTVARVIAQAG
jgi:hypothetical protein